MTRKIRRLNSFYGKLQGRKFMFQYYCKSRMFKVAFNGSSFLHVNFRGSIITYCSFKRCTFDGAEFLGTNLRKSNFEGSSFQNCVFVGTLLDGAKFKGCHFNNVVFVNTSSDKAKSFPTDTHGITVFKHYPKMNVSPALAKVLDDGQGNRRIAPYKILHLTTKKYNHLNLKLLLDRYPEPELIRRLQWVISNVDRDICTLSSLKKWLRRAL